MTVTKIVPKTINSYFFVVKSDNIYINKFNKLKI